MDTAHNLGGIYFAKVLCNGDNMPQTSNPEKGCVMRRFVLALVLLTFLASAAMADFFGTGQGFVIPDDDPGGAFSTIEVSLAPNEIISNVSVTLLALNHNWVGDLNASLTGPGGDTIDLIVRTGDTTGGGGVVGDSSNVGADYTFADGGADWWAAAAAAGEDDVIPGGFYGPTTAFGTPTSFVGTFGGTTTNGRWTLTISDNARADFGTIGGWGLTIVSTAIPEPTSMGLFGIAAVGLAFYRRRR